MSAIEAKLDTIMNMMSNQERKGHSYIEVGTVKELNINVLLMKDLLMRVPIK